jgi:hypothetical protein
MKKIVQIYKKDQVHIQNFIKTTIKSMQDDFMENTQSVFKNQKYIELLYVVDGAFKQVSSSIYKNKSVDDNINSDKSHYFRNIDIEDKEIYVSNPYLHHTTGKPSISVVHRINNLYYVFDINLIQLLEELKLIEYNTLHERFIKVVYVIAATLLTFISLTLIGYGAYILGALLFFMSTSDFLHDVFKSIIAVTIGLAMFDLSKQIMEHEVLYKSFHKEKDHEYKVLGKFLISIIIALSIETLMIVFKTVLDDYQNMFSAFFLLLGTTVMFVGLAYFYKSIIANSKEQENDFRT